jgi:hypothetical protein
MRNTALTKLIQSSITAAYKHVCEWTIFNEIESIYSISIFKTVRVNMTATE